jgi:hypothetical protein
MTDDITQNIMYILFVSVIKLKALLRYHIFAESKIVKTFCYIIQRQIRTKMYIHLSGLSSYHKISDANFTFWRKLQNFLQL